MSKGGMSKLPFGGNPSMSKLDDDFMAALFKGEISVDQAIALRIIKMSVRDYLYFGLGKNGITPEKFLEAHAYLFRVRGQDPRTWGDCRLSSRYRNVGGKLQTRRSTIQSKNVQAKCFDTHYDTSGLAKTIPVSNFLDKLKKKRESVINANLKQVFAYMSDYRAQEWRALPKRFRKGKHSFPRVNVVYTLVSPSSSGKDLARLYLFGRSPKARTDGNVVVERPNSLKYKKLLF